MALEPVGIRATIEGLNQYLSGTRDMAKGTAQVATAAGQTEKAATSARGPLTALGSTFASVAKIAAGFVVAQGLFKLPGLFGSITGAASDLNESINAVGVVFGTSTDSILAFSKTAADQVGLSARAFNELATSTGALLKNAGLPIGAVSDRTIELTKRAADMASVFNVDVSEALGAIQSALRGETEPIRRFGVNFDEAALKAEAAALGLQKFSVDAAETAEASLDLERAQVNLNKALKENPAHSLEVREAQQRVTKSTNDLRAAQKGQTGDLTQGQKLQAAYSLIMKQSSVVQDDFGNTAESAANKTRRLQSRQEDLRAELGQRFLPLQIKFLEIQNSIVSLIVAKVVPAIDKLIITLTPAGRVIGGVLEGLGKFAVGLPALFLSLPAPIQALINPIAAVILNFDKLSKVVEPIIHMFSAGFSGATIGGEFSTIERAAFNLGQIVAGVAVAFRDLGTAAGEMFHVFQLALAGGQIGGEFSAAEEAAFSLGVVIREDVIPTVTAIASFFAALVLEITNVIKAVGSFAESSGLLESFGLGVLTLVQGFVAFVKVLADVLRPIVTFFRENELARTILAVVAVIALLVSGVGTIPVAAAAAIVAIGFLRKHFEGISDFIDRNVVGSIEKLLGVIKLLVDAYLFIPRQLAGVGIEIITTIIDGILSAAPKIGEIATDVVGWFKAGFVGYVRLYMDIGKAIVDGVLAGIKASKDFFLRELGGFFTDAINYVKNKLGISSPSKEGQYIGEMFALGVQKGIQAGAAGVQAASGALLGDLRRLWNDNREFEPIIADVRRITNAAGRPDLAQAFEQAWKQLSSWARANNQGGMVDPRDPQYQAYLEEWNRRKSDLFRTVEAAAGGSGAAIGDFSKVVTTGAKGYATAASGMNTAISSGSKAIVGTINGFTAAADQALAGLSSLTAGGSGGGGGGGGGSTSAAAPLSGTHTISAGYAYGKYAPPRAPVSAPAPTAAPAPMAAPSVVVYGTPSAELLALTHAAVDQSFSRAAGQSVRQGALLPNGIG